MIDHTLIRRYIAAVYDLSVKSAQVEMVGEELARLQLAINSDPRLQGVLRHPEITPKEKTEILERIAGNPPSEIVRGLISVLLEKKRTEVLKGAADAFAALTDAARGVVRAHVEVAWEPDSAQKERLELALSRLVRAPVVTEYHLIPEVIGGARIRMAGRLIDGSLAGHLTRLAEQVSAKPALASGD
ncbi:MAG: ATP synthase F1 subunit delta [Armatimonadetes bacterium]|nr:ATP synthase F1 subunit delta [Armatimonadota bacterium]